VVTFPIKERINAELFIVRATAFYIGYDLDQSTNTLIRVVIKPSAEMVSRTKRCGDEPFLK